MLRCHALQGVYAPSEIDNNLVIKYEDRVANLTQSIYKDMNTTLYSYRTAANESALPRLAINDWAALNRYWLVQSSEMHSMRGLTCTRR